MVVGGQPGVGKTALLGALAKEGLGLFVVSRDIGKIADALRELSPDRVFVDDAHLDAAHPRNSLLSSLVWLRQELGMAFRIVATTWPGHEDDVRQLLFLTQNQGLRVDPLERKVMLELVRSVNPYFTEDLIGEILDQSEGRPGLAVTLAHWAQRGELKELVNGRLLLGQVSAGLPPPDSTIDALAPFALGGGIGMRLQSAARALGIAEIDLREALRPVSGTGVLQEFEDPGPHVGSMAVKPVALRGSIGRACVLFGRSQPERQAGAQAGRRPCRVYLHAHSGSGERGVGYAPADPYQTARDASLQFHGWPVVRILADGRPGGPVGIGESPRNDGAGGEGRTCRASGDGFGPSS